MHAFSFGRNLLYNSVTELIKFELRAELYLLSVQI